MNRSEAFSILGINSSASKDEIKKAYRTLASKNHPDKNKGSKESEEKMKKINEAYLVLSDPNHKDTTDFTGRGRQSSRGGNQNWSDDDKSVFDDIFNDFYKHSEWHDPFTEDFINKYRQSQGGDWQKSKSHDFVKSTYQTYPKSIDIDLTTIYKYNDFIRATIIVTNTKQYASGKLDNEQKTFNIKLTPREILKGNFEFQDNEIQINIIKSDNISIDKSNGNITIDVVINFVDAYCGTSKQMTLPDGRIIAIKIPQNTATHTLMKLPLHGIFAYSYAYVRVLVDIIQTQDKDFLNIMDMLKDMHVYKSQK